MLSPIQYSATVVLLTASAWSHAELDTVSGPIPFSGVVAVSASGAGHEGAGFTRWVRSPAQGQAVGSAIDSRVAGSDQLPAGDRYPRHALASLDAGLPSAALAPDFGGIAPHSLASLEVGPVNKADVDRTGLDLNRFAAGADLPAPAGRYGQPLTLNLAGNATEVPVPTAAWLFLSGLMGFLAIGKRCKSRLI